MSGGFSILLIAFLLTGCGNSRQQSAYEHAFAAEQQHQPQSITAEDAVSLIRQYQNVLEMKPGSAWAKKAQERIAVLQSRASADEAHKSVFQEHGVD